MNERMQTKQRLRGKKRKQVWESGMGTPDFAAMKLQKGGNRAAKEKKMARRWWRGYCLGQNKAGSCEAVQQGRPKREKQKDKNAMSRGSKDTGSRKEGCEVHQGPGKRGETLHMSRS